MEANSRTNTRADLSPIRVAQTPSHTHSYQINNPPFSQSKCQRYFTPHQVASLTNFVHNSPDSVQHKPNLVVTATTSIVSSPYIQTPSLLKFGPNTRSHGKTQGSTQRRRTTDRCPSQGVRSSHPPVSCIRGLQDDRTLSPTEYSQFRRLQAPRRMEMQKSLHGQDSSSWIHSCSRLKDRIPLPPDNKGSARHYTTPVINSNSNIRKRESSSPVLVLQQKHESQSIVTKMRDFWETNTSQKCAQETSTMLPDFAITSRRPVTARAKLEKPIITSVTPQQLQSSRRCSNISPNPPPISSKKTTRTTIFSFKPAMCEVQSLTNCPKLLQDQANTLPREDNRNRDGPSDSMSLLLRPLPSDTSLTTTRPLFFKTPSSKKNSSPTLPTPSIRDQNVPPTSRTSTDIQHIYEELQSRLQSIQETVKVKDARVKKRKTFIEKWDFKLPGPILEMSKSLSTDGTTGQLLVIDKGDMEISLGAEENGSAEAMVVKEADCGLREPKPLRLAELKSMMLLCRGRNGVFVVERMK